MKTTVVKTLFSAFLAIVILLSMASCGSEAAPKAELPEGSPSESATAVSENPQPTPTPTPEPVIEVDVVETLKTLNACSAETFNDEYEIQMELIEKAGKTDQWESLCKTLSAYKDYLDNHGLVSAAETYKIYDAVGEPDEYIDEVKAIFDQDQVSDELLDKVYTWGNELNLPAGLWMASDFTELYTELIPVEGDYKTSWTSPEVISLFNMFFQMDVGAMYEEFSNSYTGEEKRLDDEFTKHMAEKLETSPEELEALTYAALEMVGKTDVLDETMLASTGAYEKKDGRTIVALMIDSSNQIGSDRVGIMDMEPENSGAIVSRAKTVYEGLFGGENSDLFRLTSNPNEADIIIDMNVDYPYIDKYYAQLGPETADVYGCELFVMVMPTDMLTMESLFLQNKPGSSVYGSGGNIWMNLPSIADTEDAKTLRENILKWFK